MIAQAFPLIMSTDRAEKRSKNPVFVGSNLADSRHHSPHIPCTHCCAGRRFNTRIASLNTVLPLLHMIHDTTGCVSRVYSTRSYSLRPNRPNTQYASTVNRQEIRIAGAYLNDFHKIGNDEVTEISCGPRPGGSGQRARLFEQWR